MRGKLLLIYLISALTFFNSSLCEGRKKYYLDVRRAEEVLASLVREPIEESKWIETIGDLKHKKYIVQSGDNLWSLSKKFFKDPFLWRKLWQVNNFLTNPHILQVGEELKYFDSIDRSIAQDVAKRDKPSLTIPIVKLVPNGKVDLETQEIAYVDIKNRFYPLTISVSDEEFLGEIRGSYTERQALYEHANVYLDLLDIGSVKIGDKFSVVSFERTLEDITSPGMPLMGNLMRVVGAVKVVNIGKDYALAEITSITGRMERGDKLIEYQKAINWSLFFNPPDDLTATIIGGEMGGRTIFGQGDLVLIDKGNDDGMKSGYLFRVYEDIDYYTGSDSDVEPNFKGEVLIVHTSELSSIGLILRNTQPIFRDDTLFPNQHFFVPESSYRQLKKTIEIY